MAMDLSTATIDVAQHSDRSTLQSFIKKIKNHNLFEVKLKIDTSPTDETDKIIWTLDIPDESPPPSSTNLFKCLRNSDTDFLPDDNAQFTIVKSNSLSRSKSLRPALRTPSTHTLRMRKTVHFADSFGLDLVHQNYYEADDLSIELQKFGATYPSLFTKIIKSSRNVMLSFVKFQQRTDMEINYLTRIQSVCLQHVKFVDMNIIGTINVLNISYEKQVYVRYTTDNWRTNTETAGRYENSSSEDGCMDKFTFIISLPTDFPIGATCEFCIRYMVNGIMYWDNSQGNNYIVQAVEKIATKMKPIANLFKSTDNAHS
ncbi:putative phosphatase regulatory subunit family protein [Acanthocheilonema viteae]